MVALLRSIPDRDTHVHPYWSLSKPNIDSRSKGIRSSARYPEGGAGPGCRPWVAHEHLRRFVAWNLGSAGEYQGISNFLDLPHSRIGEFDECKLSQSTHPCSRKSKPGNLHWTKLKCKDIPAPNRNPGTLEPETLNHKSPKARRPRSLLV